MYVGSEYGSNGSYDKSDGFSMSQIENNKEYLILLH
jgi:hypothetical protein